MDYTAVLEKNDAQVQAPGLTGTPGLIVMQAQNTTPKNITVFAELASPQQILSAIQKAQNGTRPIRPGLSNPAKAGYPPHLHRTPVCDSHLALFPVCLLLQTFGKNTPGCFRAGLGLGLVTMS